MMNHSTRKFAGALIAILGFAFGANAVFASEITQRTYDSFSGTCTAGEAFCWLSVYVFDYSTGAKVINAQSGYAGGQRTSWSNLTLAQLGSQSGYDLQPGTYRVLITNTNTPGSGGFSSTIDAYCGGSNTLLQCNAWYGDLITSSDVDGFRHFAFNFTIDAPPPPPASPVFHFAVITSTSSTEFISSMTAGVANTGANLWVVASIAIGILVTFWVIVEVMALFPEEYEAERKRKQRAQDTINEFELELDRRNMATLAEMETYENMKK